MKEVVPKIKKEWVDEIIIVDGGSTDGTVEEAKRQNLKDFQPNLKHWERELLEYEYTDYISVPSQFVYNTFTEFGIPEEKLIKNT